MQGKVKLEDIFNELGWDCDSAIADDFHRIFKNLVDEEEYLDFDKAEIQLALRDFIEANESDYQGDIIHSILDKYINDEFIIADNGIDESYEILAEDPMDDEDVSFREIIDRMSIAEDYCELYDAADLIADPALREQVIDMIAENEDEDEEVDVVYSIVTTEYLDPKIHDKNVISLEESKKVEGLYDDCYKTSDREELKEIALNAIYVANNNDEIVSELLDRVTEEDLADYNVNIEDLKSKLYDFVANNYTNMSIELLREIALNAVYVANDDETIRQEMADREDLYESESSVIDSLLKDDEEVLKDAIEDLKDDEDEAIEGYEDFKDIAAEHVSEDTIQDLNNVINEIEDDEKEHLEILNAVQSGLELNESKSLNESNVYVKDLGRTPDVEAREAQEDEDFKNSGASIIADDTNPNIMKNAHDTALRAQSCIYKLEDELSVWEEKLQSDPEDKEFRNLDNINNALRDYGFTAIKLNNYEINTQSDIVNYIREIINQLNEIKESDLNGTERLTPEPELSFEVENKSLEEASLGNNTFTDRDEAEYYRNKELYDYSHLARHKEAMDKAKEACDKKGIQVNTDRGIYESKDNTETKTPREEIEDMIQRTYDREYKTGIEESKELTDFDELEKSLNNRLNRVIELLGDPNTGDKEAARLEQERDKIHDYLDMIEGQKAKTEYRYITNHGVGPGTLPEGTFVRSEDLEHGKTAIYTNRPLTAEELEKYDIKPEWIQESKEVKTESNVVWSSAYNYDEDTVNQAYDEYVNDFVSEPVSPISFEKWLENTEESWFESVFEQYKEEHPDWEDEDERSLEYKLNGMVADEIAANMDELKDQYNEYCEEVKNSGHMTSPLDREKWEFSFAEQDAQDQWEVMSENFSEVVFPKIEAQCNHDKLILLGSVGRWNGTYGGGKVIDAEEDELRKLMSDYDEISVTEDDGNLSINFEHHDGTDSMELFTFPQDLTKLAKAMGYDDVDEFESDMINDYLSESDLAEHSDLLIPIKYNAE